MKPCHDCEQLFASRTRGLRCPPCGAKQYAVQTKAYSLVTKAIREGVLVNLTVNSVPCVDCGCRATQYDHRDYAAPLDVQPVCRTCNHKRGPAAPMRTPRD